MSLRLKRSVDIAGRCVILGTAVIKSVSCSPPEKCLRVVDTVSADGTFRMASCCGERTYPLDDGEGRGEKGKGELQLPGIRKEKVHLQSTGKTDGNQGCQRN